MADEQESFGELRFPDGKTEKIVALFTIYRDDREATVCETDGGSIVVSTKSWLRQNNHELVHTIYPLTKETFVMMAEAMILGAEYLGIDVIKQAAMLHASDGDKVSYEYAGRGEPKFKADTE